MNIHVETIGDKSCVYGTGCEATALSGASSIRRYGSARLPLRACVRACVRACNETRQHPPELVRNTPSSRPRQVGLLVVWTSVVWERATPLWKEWCHLSRGYSNQPGGNVLICHGEGRMSALIWDHTHRNCRWRALPRVFKVMMSHREVITSISDVLMLAWSETRLLT